ncbi:hypothetical protein N9B58_00845 [bacterium]|nr:hypothetical protein [bacterium]
MEVRRAILQYTISDELDGVHFCRVRVTPAMTKKIRNRHESIADEILFFSTMLCGA